MADSLPELSKAEWLIMKACWEKKNSTARDVYEAIGDQREWEYQTVKTMLDRLVDKGYLTLGKVGPISIFTPAIAKTKVVKNAIEGFVDTVLGDQLTPLLVHLAGSDRLSDTDIAMLKKLLEENK